MALANVLVAGAEDVLNELCLTGLVPAMARHASSKWPRSLRLHAAVFLHAMCHASASSLQLVVICRVCPCKLQAATHQNWLQSPLKLSHDALW